MDFKDLCIIVDKVKQSKLGNEKVAVFREFFASCRNKIGKENIFSVVRLILPDLDRDRQSYNMKEARVARVLIKMLALPPGGDKNILTNSYLMSGQASDFGDVVYSVIRKYLSSYKTTLTINELNTQLDRIAQRNNEADDILLNLFRKSSAEDSRWIIRILLKDLKLGISKNRILNCYHKDAVSFYLSNSNLKKVCDVLFDEDVKLHELDIEIFQAFRPMLSKRVDNSSFIKDFKENELYCVELKFDGERFQLHMEKGQFKYFSRNGFDYTEHYGSTYDKGLLTPKLKDLFQPFVQRVILDGEMMLWSKRRKQYGSKGMAIDIKKIKETHSYQPCFCVFDIILLNDNILTNKPFRERAQFLKKVFKKQMPGTLVLSEVKEVQSRQAIVNEFNSAIEKEEEGIVIKDPNSIYKYSDRVSGWFKMKLEFFQDTMNDLDLILMGGQYASSTSDQLNSFIVGVKSDTDPNPVYLALGKVSSGLNAEQLDMLNKLLKTDGRVFNASSCDGSLVFGKEVPNYYVCPEKSLIFVVRATELIRHMDSSYKTPYTVRFPRVVNIRTDKPVNECLGTNELFNLCNKDQPVIKLNKRSISLEEILQAKPAKKRKIIVPTYASTEPVADLLENFKVYVHNGSEEISKEDVEALVKRAGGTIVYRIDDSLDIILAGSLNNHKLQQLIKRRNNFDIINIAWLLRITKEGDLLGYEPQEIFGLGTRIKNSLSDEVDAFGDSYTEDTTVDSLKRSFNLMTNLKEIPNFLNITDVENFKTFKEYTAYFDKYLSINDPDSEIVYESSLDELEFQHYNGKICKCICPQTNLVIFNENNERSVMLTSYLKSIDRTDIEVQPKSFIYQFVKT